MVRFDAYSATTTAAKAPELMSVLLQAGGIGAMHKIRQGKGFHTFGDRIGVVNEQGVEWASVMWGGHQGDRAMIEVKGDATPKAVEALRERFEHRCTRVDACADFDSPAAFESLLGSCSEVKKKHRLKGEKMGDWDDFPELGRTLYLGARSSTCRVRLYEKGKQPEYRHLNVPNLTRIELQVRPVKAAKTAYSEISPIDVWGASSWTRELAGKVLQEHIDPHPAGTVYRLTERDAAIAWMCKQYGSHLVGLASDLGGWECLGLTLKEVISEQSRKRRQ